MSTNGEYLNNTAYFFIGKEPELKLLLKALNSKVLDWYYRTLSVQLGEKAVRMFSIYVLKIPIPKERIIKLLNVDDELIDSTMCSIYGLTDIERQAIGVQ
jgi:hypothetical protein